MKNLFLIAAAMMLWGCSSAPQLAVPDGKTKTPVNSAAAIQAYNAKVYAESAEYQQSRLVNRQIAALRSDLDAVKQTVDDLAARSERQSLERQSKPSSNIRQSEPVTESLAVKERSILVTRTHATGKTAFALTEPLRKQLLAAAQAAPHIEIRGRTDGQSDTIKNAQTSAARAENAKAYLVANGIPATKISVSAMATGGFVADNRTREGQARNRRVEIECSDIDTKAFTAITSQSSKEAP